MEEFLLILSGLHCKMAHTKTYFQELTSNCMSRVSQKVYKKTHTHKKNEVDVYNVK